MFSLYGELKGRLSYCINQAFQADAPLVFGHICWGILSKAGAFRLTEINCKPNEQVLLQDYKNKYGVTHEEAFRLHINLFGRSSTLLDWLSLFMYERITFSQPNLNETNTYNLAEGKQHFAFLISEDIIPCLTVEGNSLMISEALYETLLPQDVTATYLEGLYKESSSKKADGEIPAYLRLLAEQLVGARGAAIKLMKDENCLQLLDPLSDMYKKVAAIPEGFYEWVFLGALQTGLMYVNASTPKTDVAKGFVSVACCYNVHDEKPTSDNPLALLSGVLPSSFQIENLQDFISSLYLALLGPIRQKINSVIGFNSLPSSDIVRSMKSDRWDPSVWETNLVNEIRDAFAIHAFPKWTSALVLWLTLITEKMRNSIHEGHLLNFSFVVADRSQILDSGLFDTLDLDFAADDRMLPWSDDGRSIASIAERDHILNQVRQSIGKKNYAWFQEGKYALLWDATFPSKHPQSLIRFKDSSWDVFVTHTRMGKAGRATEIVAAMAYLRADGSGGVIIKGQQILSFRKNQKWALRGGELQNEVSSVLRGFFEQWQMSQEILDSTESIFARALLAISDDPHAGCILVIFGRDRESDFEDMGKPWEKKEGYDPLTMTQDELTALMSMDGATCVYLKDGGLPAIAFRGLVKVPEAGSGINKEKKEEYLDGEGSRKWSGAYAATSENVEAVISVSQDGPIFIFKKQSVPEVALVGSSGADTAAQGARLEVTVDVLGRERK